MRKHKYSKKVKNAHSANTKEKKIKKEAIFTFVIAVIMISSIIGFIYTGNEEEPAFTYKDTYEFTRANNGYSYSDGEKDYFFRFMPNEIEDMAESADFSMIKPPQIYVTFSPESESISTIELLRFELFEDLKNFNILLQSGITEDSSIYSFPLIDCNNATEYNPVVKFIRTNVTEVESSGSCLILKGKSDFDLARLKDMIIYKLLGII